MFSSPFSKLLTLGESPSQRRQNTGRDAEKGYAECAKFLAAPGIDVNATDEFSTTPLFIADFNGHTECAELIRATGGRISLVETPS